MPTPFFAHRTVFTQDGARLEAYVREPANPRDRRPSLSCSRTVGPWGHESWDLVAALLPDTLRVVRYDQRGHGRSTFGGGSRKPQQESVRRLGSDLATVIAECVPDDSPLILAGTRWVG